MSRWLSSQQQMNKSLVEVECGTDVLVEDPGDVHLDHLDQTFRAFPVPGTTEFRHFRQFIATL